MAKQLPANPTYYVVPAGARASTCRGAAMGGGCTARIYFVDNPKKPGKQIPIDCDVPDGVRPGPAVDVSQTNVFAADATPQNGRGVSHYLTCPDADLFTRGGAR